MATSCSSNSNIAQASRIDSVAITTVIPTHFLRNNFAIFHSGTNVQPCAAISFPLQSLNPD